MIRSATGTTASAATSVPPFAMVNVAVYDVVDTRVKLPRSNPPMVPLVNVYVSPPSSPTVMVAVTSSPTFIAAFGMATAEIVGTFASIGSPAWEIGVVYSVLGVVPSVRIRLTGISDPAATSVPPSAMVNVAV